MRVAIVALLLVSCAKPEAVTPAPDVPAAPSVEITQSTATAESATVAESQTIAHTTSSQAPVQPVPQKNITIDAITVANPLIVRGRARTFENSVSVRVRDAKGALVSETHTTSRGEMGRHNPYEATLWLTRESGPRITVEALEYSAKDGSEQSVVREERAFAVAPVRFDLYLPDANCTAVKPVTRTMPKSISLARLVAEALVRTAPFPKGSEVRSVILRSGVLTVDFNERLQNVGGSCAVRMIRQSVTQTMLHLPNVKEVVITAGGSKDLALQP
ncbi:MAG TPA: Gmad2 immunoglobulin-like domain-containing protein [Thermoanaerobaculia bacterium]|nr:Gmad2 immunoglobulin-like domain-containing protein [Thermoanaerobaculia bacterium]